MNELLGRQQTTRNELLSKADSNGTDEIETGVFNTFGVFCPVGMTKNSLISQRPHIIIVQSSRETITCIYVGLTDFAGSKLQRVAGRVGTAAPRIHTTTAHFQYRIIHTTLSCWGVVLFCFPSHLLPSPFLSCSLLLTLVSRVVGLSPPPDCGTIRTYVPCIFIARRSQHFLPSSTLASNCAYARDNRRSRLFQEIYIYIICIYIVFWIQVVPLLDVSEYIYRFKRTRPVYAENHPATALKRVLVLLVYNNAH